MKRWVLPVLLLATPSLLPAVEISSWLSYQIRQEQTLDAFGRNFTSVAVFAYDFDTNDNLRPAQPWVDTELNTLMTTPHAGRPVFITIVNDIESNPPQQHNGQLILRVLSDPAKRAAHIQQLVALSARADGIDIDYEGLLTGTRPHFTQFIQELRAALPPGKLLSVICQPKTSTDDGPRGQAIDWVAIQPYVDIMKIMTYYYSFGASPPGPSAPLDKVHDIVQLAVSEIPSQKLHVVLTQFGFDWPENGPGQFLSYEEANQIARLHNVTPFRDPVSQVLRANYDEGGVSHQIWFDDSQSLLAKVAIIQSEGVQKIDVWQLGVGDPNFWNWVSVNAVNPNGAQNPPPVLSSISPVSVSAGAGDIQLTLMGSNFVTSSVVRWNGQNRPTTFVSDTVLRVNIPAGDVSVPGQALLTVFNPPPGGGLSAGQIFTVTFVNPPPVLASVSPATVFVGGSDFTLTATGSNFLSNSLLLWNGAVHPTTVLNGTTLTATVSASDIASLGTAAVVIFNPPPGGGFSSPQTVAIVTPLSPALSSLDPDSITAGSPNFSLVVAGENFRPDAVVHWNGLPRPTSVISSTQARAAISAGDVITPGTATITVVDSVGASNSLPFLIKQGSVAAPPVSPIAPISDLSQVHVFPNPWRAGSHQGLPITFDFLPNDSTIKLYTLSSRWIKSIPAPLGSATWDLTNDSDETVSSGFYFYFVTDPSGHETKGKVAIIK